MTQLKFAFSSSCHKIKRNSDVNTFFLRCFDNGFLAFGVENELFL